MPVLLWGILAIVAGLAILAIAGRAGRATSPPLPPDVDLPRTALQRLAARGLVAGALLAAAAGAMVGVYGPERLNREDGPRLVFTVLLLAVAGVFLFVTMRVRTWARRGDGVLDERDRAILDRAPAYQATSMLVTIAIWMTGLIESYHDAGAVPLYYLYLVFWSCWIVDLLALPVGILVGYRRA
jgi:high-affinity Fe2+/Pb2+ permease